MGDEPIIDPVQCAEWLIASSDKARATGTDIGLGHAAGRVVAVELLQAKKANANLLAACEKVLEYITHPEGSAPNGLRLITACDLLRKVIAKGNR